VTSVQRKHLFWGFVCWYAILFQIVIRCVEAFAAETIQTNRTQREFDSPYRIDSLIPSSSVWLTPSPCVGQWMAGLAATHFPMHSCWSVRHWDSCDDECLVDSGCVVWPTCKPTPKGLVSKFSQKLLAYVQNVSFGLETCSNMVLVLFNLADYV